VSVDTYLKGKDTSSYRSVTRDDVTVLLAPNMVRWARSIRVGTKGPRFRRGFDVAVEHEHGPACRH
jgi:hypothetical protein